MSATRYANLSGATVIKCKLGRQRQIFSAPSHHAFILTERVPQGLPLQPLSSCLAEFSAAKGKKRGPSPRSESISRFQRQAGLEVAGPLCLNALPDPRHLASEQEVVVQQHRHVSAFILCDLLYGQTHVHGYLPLKTNRMEFNERKDGTYDPINKILHLCLN